MKKITLIILILLSVGCTTTPKPMTAEQAQPPVIEQIEETAAAEIEEDGEDESIEIPNPFSGITAGDWLWMGIEAGLWILLDMPGASWEK